MPQLQRPRNIDEKLNAMINARVKAIEVKNENKVLAFSTETFNKLDSFLPIFEREVDDIKKILDNQSEAMWLKQKNLSLLRLYVSHFVKVFNFAIERSVFTTAERAYYGMDINSEAMPYIKGEADIILWVKKLINGEKQRTEKGYDPMCNPSIKDIEDVYKKYITLDNEQTELKEKHQLGIGDISILINEADELLKDIWDEVEFFYRKESNASTIKLCSEYGLVFNFDTEDNEIAEELMDN